MAKRHNAVQSLVNPAILSDFRNFLYVIWKHLQLPDPTPVQYDIASYLQHGPKRQIIEGFRGVGKSWITSAFVLWSLMVDPQAKFLVVSASKQRADDFSTFTLRLIREVPILKHLYPRDDQRESKIAFDVAPARAAHAPSVKSAGIFGQLSGSRATHIIADDYHHNSRRKTSRIRWNRTQHMVTQHRAKPVRTGTCNDYSVWKYAKVGGSGRYWETSKELVYSHG